MKSTLATALTRRLPASLLAAWLAYSELILATDWPMFGRDQTRNAVSPEKNPPWFWNLEVDPQGQPVPGRGQNIKWVARLGNLSFSAPVFGSPGEPAGSPENSPFERA